MFFLWSVSEKAAGFLARPSSGLKVSLLLPRFSVTSSGHIVKCLEYIFITVKILSCFAFIILFLCNFFMNVR